VTPPSGSGGAVSERRALRRGADGARQLPPCRQPRERQRQVQDDPPRRALDPHGKLDEPLAQRGDLRVGTRGRPGSPPRSAISTSSSREHVTDGSAGASCTTAWPLRASRDLGMTPLPGRNSAWLPGVSRSSPSSASRACSPYPAQGGPGTSPSTSLPPVTADSIRSCWSLAQARLESRSLQGAR
jgi:hypothetical protein